METFFAYVEHYSILGYDVNLSKIYNQESIKMTKRYSHTRQAPVICEQIQEYSKLKDITYLSRVLDWLYDNIKEQEKTKNYYEPYGQ